jgi:tRNA nucleotidyltransferase (CCA-adding enzyme)
MTLSLPFEVLYILYILQKNNFEAFIVGGAVRDLIINSIKKQSDKIISDFDFTTNATPEQIQKLFKDSFYENDFGTVGVAHEHLLEQMQLELKLPQENLQSLLSKTKPETKDKIIDYAKSTKLHESLNLPDSKSYIPHPKSIHPFEITTFRTEGEYQDFRRPDSVSWGKTIEEDLNRRDFSVNAMALSINSEELDKIFSKPINSNYCLQPNAYSLIDPHTGIKDLAATQIRAVGEPEKRFSEDSLRMLRAIRLAVQLNMEIEPETLAAISKNQQLINHISLERIGDEFMKIMASNNPTLGINLLDQTGLIKYVLPELLDAKDIQQGGHHNTDVWTHSLDALANCPSTDPVVRLSTLLHDVSKPETVQEIKGQITNYNHEIVGSRVAVKVARRLRLSKKDQQKIFTLVRYHMFYYQPKHTDASIRRFMRKVGLENLDDILALREGDRLGSGARKTSWRLEEMKKRMIEQLHQPFEIRDLAINGDDLMKEFNLKPGKQIGEILHKLFEVVLEDPEKNNKEILLTKAKELAK